MRPGRASLLAEVQTGDISDDDAPGKLVDMAKKYASIFMGESAACVAQPWNATHRLGVYMRG